MYYDDDDYYYLEYQKLFWCLRSHSTLNHISNPKGFVIQRCALLRDWVSHCSFQINATGWHVTSQLSDSWFAVLLFIISGPKKCHCQNVKCNHTKEKNYFQIIPVIQYLVVEQAQCDEWGPNMHLSCIPVYVTMRKQSESTFKLIHRNT